jgi:hypothetical protein
MTRMMLLPPLPEVCHNLPDHTDREGVQPWRIARFNSAFITDGVRVWGKVSKNIPKDDKLLKLQTTS